jgi:hypothetical protein
MYRLFFSVFGSFFFCLFSFGQNVIYSEMLGRPTNSGVTVEAIFDTTAQVRVSYGTSSGVYPSHTSWQLANKDSVKEAVAVINLTNLTPDTKYFYKLQYRKPGDTLTISRPEHSFHTARVPGDAFTFVIQADPHLDASSDTALYRLCLKNQLEDDPDFMIDLGDNFMTDKLNDATHHVPEDTIPYRCKLLRSFYETVNHSVPLFLVIGNHEGECGWYQNGTASNIAVWNTKYRKKYYTNPAPDGFYSGDTTHYNFVGQREAYYSWTWGDAQFIVLDPFWNTNPKPDSLHCWRWSLGKQQYDWLKTTLENSASPYKFVFIHNLVGGDAEGRGGIEKADFYEWGGLNIDSTDGWSANRAGWYKPIKDLLTEHKVTIMFHGHDHFFGKQDMDCLLYQEVPQPSLPNFNNVPQAADYGYLNGIIIPNSGHLRVNVSPTGVTVDYVRAVRPIQETAILHNKDISETYHIGIVNCYDSLQSGIPDIGNENYNIVTVYPNPTASNSLVVKTEKAKDYDRHIELINTTGETVVSDDLKSGNTSALLNITNIASGLYFIKVIDGLNSCVFKITVSK